MASGLAAMAVALGGCGDTASLTSADVERAFNAAGIQLSVVIDPHLFGTGNDSVSKELIKYGPKIMSAATGSTDKMSVLVYPLLKDAKAADRSYAQLIADVHAHPARYAKNGGGQIENNSVVRVSNVVVLYRKTEPGLTSRITRAVKELREAG
jgi:hypothetical protein